MRDLAQLLGQYGGVLGASIHGGFAFVQMEQERDANRAIVCEDGQQFKGSKIRGLIHGRAIPLKYAQISHCMKEEMLETEPQ